MPPVIPPLGVAPLGTFGEVQRTPYDLPPVIRADAIDPSSGEFVSFFTDVHPIDEQVVGALWRVSKSGASVWAIGNDLRTVRLFEAGFARLVESKARNALKSLVAGGFITIEAIRVTSDESDNAATLVVEYINQRRASERRRLIQVPITGASR